MTDAMRDHDHRPGRALMDSFLTDDPIDAERWLYVHADEVVGAEREAAVDLVMEAGLVSHVASRGAAPDPGVPDPGRIRLFIGDDGKVRSAQSG